uniref:transcriptional regulator n=1 Tax=Pararhizobium sp. IMCC3301 TaxID=3067904 RepID=UPI00274036A3|nr:transcriptional regulator [Pararhizobium sp. IMCC3301]
MKINTITPMKLVLAVLAGLWALPVNAAELIMMEQDGCVWCQRWRAELGPIYPKTEEGKRAPLRVINIFDPVPDDLSQISIDRFTPTFVLIDGGVELGRIRGYPGEELFWWVLSDLVKKLPEPAESPAGETVPKT